MDTIATQARHRKVIWVIMLGALLYLYVILFLFGRQSDGFDDVSPDPSTSPLTTENAIPSPETAIASSFSDPIESSGSWLIHRL